MVSTTDWQADASLWKDDTFFDAGTFCLPSISPQASLEAYTVVYDLKTGIHDVSLTMKGILGLSASSTSSQSSHVTEFSNGVMKAVPRRKNGGDTAGFPTEAVNNGVEDCEPQQPFTCEEISLHQQATSPPACPEIGAPIDVPKEGDSSSNMISNTESSEEPITNSDNLGIINSTQRCQEITNSLHILTDLVSEDDNSPLSSSASETSSDNSANTRSKPVTAGTSPTFSLAEDLLEPYARQAEASTTIAGLDLEESGLNPKPWRNIPFQWLDLAITDRQYCHWEDIQGKEEPESVQEDETVDIVPRLCNPAEVERPPQEAGVPDDEAGAEHHTAQVETTNDYQPDGREFHHRNILRYPVYQASRTSSALSLWVIMTSKRRAQIEDCVSLKAVVSSQATRWVDPVLLQEGVSVPEEVRDPGNATACRNFLTGLTTIQYEPYGTWQSETYDHEQEIPYPMDSETKKIFDDAYSESHGFPGLQRPCFMKEHEPLGYSFSNPQLKEQRGWESPERLGDSNLRFVMDEESIARWRAPAVASASYEVAEATDLQEGENYHAENSFVSAADESEIEVGFDDGEGDKRWEKASPLPSLLAFPSTTRQAMSSLSEGRFFTPRMREEYEELEDLSDDPDGEAWETDENGAFVSPKKGKERFRGEMGEDFPSGAPRADEDPLGLPETSFGQLIARDAQGDEAPAFTVCHYEAVDVPPAGIFRNPVPELGSMIPTEGATKDENALPTPVGEPSTPKDVLQAELSPPNCKYNDVSEIPSRPDFAATVGQAAREFGTWLTENMLW